MTHMPVLLASLMASQWAGLTALCIWAIGVSLIVVKFMGVSKRIESENDPRDVIKGAYVSAIVVVVIMLCITVPIFVFSTTIFTMWFKLTGP